MKTKVTEGSGNVFADLGMSQPKERQAKAMIALHIERLIEESGWTQAQAAEKMHLLQPEVSKIVNGRLQGFTLDRLFDCLNALGQDIEIGIKPRASASEEEKVLVPY